MKKFFVLGFSLLALALQAQITVTTDGNVITNGQIFTFNTTAIASELPFRVANNTSEPIFLKLKMTNMTNTTGSSVQFCFGVCLYNVSAGLLVPPSFPIEIAPGDITPNGDHFWNSNAGDGINYPIEYTLTFVETTDDGTYVGDLLSFKYQYNPNLSVGTFADLAKLGVQVKQTKVTNAVDVESQEPVMMEVFNLNGQSLRHATINGQQSVDLSGLATGAYLLHFTSKTGAQANIRIIKE
ncbi:MULTISPECIES: T9SS type A sorting domain-containing protein [unclassified Flavobacterium]|uniref:T9SS type A sorting domain-containing protein n=1 Tax=unclassified Flavobacterium TaxID=196869 RepID=UPI001F14048F|nr:MULTISPECIES: T9SS type A sorting domain-containing protein [unclassified Flavobacterium]UMY66638.1 T9SS type A sorting domain-containing protein [Flavobacterium sp. HJ-32-4]